MESHETKIELVTEAGEAVVLATVVVATGSDKDRAMNHRNVVDARATVAEAFKVLLAPTLRVVDSEPPALRITRGDEAASGGIGGGGNKARGNGTPAPCQNSLGR